MVALALAAAAGRAEARCERVEAGGHWAIVVPGRLPGMQALVIGADDAIVARENLPQVGPGVRCIRLEVWASPKAVLYVVIEVAPPGSDGTTREHDLVLVYRYRDRRLELLEQAPLAERRWTRTDDPGTALRAFHRRRSASDSASSPSA